MYPSLNKHFMFSSSSCHLLFLPKFIFEYAHCMVKADDASDDKVNEWKKKLKAGGKMLFLHGFFQYLGIFLLYPFSAFELGK